MSRDPVLTALTQLIADDEVRHYKHFYRYLRKYRAQEGQHRPGIAGAVWNRLRMIDGEDSRLAMRHIYRARKADDRSTIAASRRCGGVGGRWSSRISRTGCACRCC